MTEPKQAVETSNPEAFARGLATRREVMGDAFVDAAFAGVNAFTAPLQEHITRAAWGDVWQRPGLDRKTRSLITVAMLTALGKQNELKGHVRGALNNGATVEQIQEVLLHATVYCGVPAAVEAFRSANEVVSAQK
ncbi:MAG: 4-carboxymuconolactone decarboxylase [Betaproteobacteria bacterium]|nr:4-carboxymuconolactone decarboxylase [Betaproteobacteria bacterium]